MVETSYPFASPPGNTMTENQWAQMFRYVLGTGVISVSFQDELNQLIVSPGPIPLTVNVDSGAAWIQGHYYQNSAVNTLTIPQNMSADVRADYIVLELKWGLNAGITANVVTGDPGAVWPASATRTGPMPPTLVQVYGVKWQLPLAQVNTTQNMSSVYSVSQGNIGGGLIDWRTFVGSGGARSSTFVVASADASPTIRANADAVIPDNYSAAEEIINSAIVTVSGYGGGTVLLSEGTFTTSSAILALSNVNLSGLGTRTIINYQVAPASANNYPIIDCESISNTVISNLAINGGLKTTPSGGTQGFDGIYLNNCNLTTIRNCNITNCLNCGVYYFSTTSGPTDTYGNRIEGCYVASNNATGIMTEANNGIITNNQVVGNWNGIMLSGMTTSGSWGPSINLVTSNNVRLNYGNGIFLTADLNCSQNIISNNIVVNNGQSATHTFYNIVGTNTKVMANTIMGNHCGNWLGWTTMQDIWFTPDTHDNLILGNMVNNSCYVQGTNCSQHNYTSGTC